MALPVRPMLDKAGWKVNANSGLREKEGVPAVMTLYYKAGDSVREQLALTVAQMVKPLGISMSVKGSDWDTIAGKAILLMKFAICIIPIMLPLISIILVSIKIQWLITILIKRYRQRHGRHLYHFGLLLKNKL